MSATRVRGELGPACAKCESIKTWSGTRWLCRPCQARANRDRKARLSDNLREAERVRANELRNARRAEWTPEKRAASNAQVAKWREENREHHRQLSRDWYWSNAERARRVKAAHYEANSVAYYTKNLLRKARRADALCGHGPECVDLAFLTEVYAADCAYCAAPAEHADHYMPLALGGLHCRENIVPACQPCNSSKYATHPDEWLARRAAG